MLRNLPAEGEVRSLDRVEEQRCVGASILDPQEGGIAFELRQPERRIQATDNGLKQVAGDRGRVLQLAPRERYAVYPVRSAMTRKPVSGFALMA